MLACFSTRTGFNWQDRTGQQKYPAAVWFLLDALKRYATLPVEKVREIAFEIALLGQRGLDYASPEKKYSLRSLPGESFSGLQLMCLMHAGFQQIAPEQYTGMDLAGPFLMALQLFNEERAARMPPQNRGYETSNSFRRFSHSS